MPSGLIQKSPLCAQEWGPVTLLRMIETYELHMKIISFIFIHTKKPLKSTELCIYLPYWTYEYRMSSVSLAYAQHMKCACLAYRYHFTNFKPIKAVVFQHCSIISENIQLSTCQTRRGHCLLVAEEKGRRFHHHPHPKLVIHLFIYLQIYLNHLMYLTHLLIFLRHLLMMYDMFRSTQGP
jgi:hypothetical protein